MGFFSGLGEPVMVGFFLAVCFAGLTVWAMKKISE